MVEVWLRGLWIKGQAGLSAKSVDEFMSVLDALEQPLGAGGELVHGAGEQVAQIALDVRPHALGGVELRGVGRQLDHGQPVVVRLAEPAHRGAAVHVEGEVGRRRGARGSGPFPSAPSRTVRAALTAHGSPVITSGGVL